MRGLLVILALIGCTVISAAAWGASVTLATAPIHAGPFLYGPCPYPTRPALRPAHAVEYARFDQFGRGRTSADL